MKLAIFVTGHGFGHATRQAALISELLSRTRCKILLVSNANATLFPSSPSRIRFVSRIFDLGVIQSGPLDVDHAENLAAHLRFTSQFKTLVSSLTELLADFAPDAVLSDAAAAPVAAARRCGIPAFIIGNFTWDWIFEGYAERDRRWRELVGFYAAAYAEANAYWRLPFHGAEKPIIKNVLDFPHLVRKRSMALPQILRGLGISPRETRPIVMVSFGGFPLLPHGGPSQDLSDFIFIAFTPKPQGLRTKWIRLPKMTPLSTVDISGACSVVIGKLGYGTAAECLAYRQRMIYVPRLDFRETPGIQAVVSCLPGFVELSRNNFIQGRWRTAIETALAQTPSPKVPADAASKIRRRLLKQFGDS